MRQRRGYSLVELLAALAILGFVITITMAAFVERNRRIRQATELILAYQALSNEAEFLRRTNYKDLKTTTEFQSDTSLLRPMQPFTTVVHVEETSPGLKSVTITIRWRKDQTARLALVRADTGGTNLW